MGEIVKNKSVMHKWLGLVMLVGVLAVAGIPDQGLGALTAEAASTPIDSMNFPDANFRTYVTEKFDTDEDGILSDVEINAVTVIRIYGESISSLVGVENFRNLQRLDCDSTQISSLDVSHNTALTDLDCSDTQISSLDVSHNTALTDLYCDSTQISSLDVSHNTALTVLYCDSTQISSLDVSQNTALTDLDCSMTELSSLDVSQNTELNRLICFRTALSSLDVSHNTALDFLYCDSTRISRLDVSKNIALTWLFCDSTQISSLDVSQNTALTDLRCENTQLSSLDVSHNTALSYLDCSSAQLNSLDVSQNSRLSSLKCDNNRFSNGMSSFDTARLDGFDLARASNWTNASISGTVVTAVDTSSPVTYIYDCGNNFSRTFTFIPPLVKYTVTFNANGGNSSTSSKRVTYGSTYGTLPMPTRTGYNFTGWYTSANGGSQVTSSTTVNTLSNHTLYAHWTADIYTITFNANGGSCTIASKSVTYGNTYGTLPTPIRAGYSFAGWYTSASGGSQMTSNTTVNITSDQTLHAHWTANTYTVTFNANDGSCNTSSKTVTYGSSYGALPTPTREGYSFSGWYASLSDGSQVTSSTPVNIAQNHTLYAYWTKNVEPQTNPRPEQPGTIGGGQQVQKPSNPGVTEKRDIKLKMPAKQNNKKRIEKLNISLESATGVTKADQYMVLGKTKVSKKKLVLKLKTSGVKIQTYKSSNKKVATVSKKGLVKLKKIGTTTITVTAVVTATGKKISKKYNLTVNPDKTILESVQSKATGKITIKWKQNSSGDGYEIYRSLSRNFKEDVRTYKIPGSKETAATIKDLIPGAKYYIKVRNYKLVSGKPYYGAWSKRKAVKVK